MTSEPVPSEIAERLIRYAQETADFVGATDDQGRIVYLNGAARHLLGLPPDGAPDLTTADLFTEDAFERYFDEVRPALLRHGEWNGTVSVRTPDGPRELWAGVVGEVDAGGEVRWLVTMARDLSAWLRSQEGLLRRATHDELTDLAGRTLLADRLEQALERNRRTAGRTGVLFVDLDGFKAVNDRYGHPVGDTVLVEVADRLRSAVRTADTVARVGGDEFVVLLDDIAGELEARTTAERIRLALERDPVAVGDGQLWLSASVGLAVGGPESDAATLVAAADEAMYRAKAAAHEQAGREQRARRDATPHQVAVALTQGNVAAHYEPVAALDGLRVVGHQAVARLVHRHAGTVLAQPIPEAVLGAGVASSVDLAVLRHAGLTAGPHLGDAAIWVALCLHTVGLADLPVLVASVLERAGRQPSLLRLTVPVDAVTSDDTAVVARLEQLAATGATLVVTGELGDQLDPALARLVDEVVVALDDEPELTPAQRRTFQVAADSGWRSHASGVSTSGQLEALRALGCTYVQGPLVGPAVPQPEAR